MYIGQGGQPGIATYSAAGDSNSASRLVLLGDLRKALDTPDQLLMHYQPKIDLRTGEVVGLEALLRWQHPVRGLVAPGDFIPSPSRPGSCTSSPRASSAWSRPRCRSGAARATAMPVAVNLSARNLLEPDLDEIVASLLDMHHLSPSLLEFEITECAIIEDPARASAMLRKLTAMGISVAVDDFGIGNTSMGQLRVHAPAHDQDRPLVRHEPGQGHGGRRARQGDRRPRARVRPAGRRGGRRGRAS